MTLKQHRLLVIKLWLIVVISLLFIIVMAVRAHADNGYLVTTLTPGNVILNPGMTSPMNLMLTHELLVPEVIPLTATISYSDMSGKTYTSVATANLTVKREIKDIRVLLPFTSNLAKDSIKIDGSAAVLDPDGYLSIRKNISEGGAVVVTFDLK